MIKSALKGGWSITRGNSVGKGIRRECCKNMAIRYTG